MIIYNVTVKVDHEVHDEWLQWMRTVHIPEVMATGHFMDNQIARIMVEEEDGITYAIQYRCQSMEEYRQYESGHAARLRAEHTARFKDRFVAFRTLMEIVA